MAAGAFSPLGDEPSTTKEADEPWAVLGDCELLEEIGRGGMGVVYRARQRRLGREVAVKVLRGGELAAREARERFKAEAENAAALRHPGIVAVHDFGEEQGVCWICMEFVAGRTLDEATRHQPMSARVAADCVRQIAEAVHHAHARGVLHRDLKPANILLDAENAPRIADFGIARRMEGGAGCTRTRQLLGSPGYSAPEQALRGEADARTDVYGLGAILYSILTSRPPFQGPTAESVLVQLREEEPLAPRRLNPAVPRDLENIVLKCIARDPARRYTSAAAVAEDLAAFRDGRPVNARSVPAHEKAWRWCRRRPGLAAALSFAVLSLSGGTVTSLALAGRARAAAEKARHSEATAQQAAEETRRTLYAATMLRVQDDMREGSPLAADALAKQAPARGATDLRGWEWHWLNSQLHQGRLLRDDGRPGEPRAVAISPDGRRIAVSTFAGTEGHARVVQVLDAESLAVEKTFSGFDREVPYLDWHPDGVRLLTCDAGGVVSAWDTSGGGTRLWRLEIDPVDELAYRPPRGQWSPDGTQCAIHSFRSGLTLHRAENGAELRHLFNRQPLENPLAWHPGGTQIAIAAATGGVQVVNTLGEPILLLPLREDVSALAWSHDGARLAIGTSAPLVVICDPARPDHLSTTSVGVGSAGHMAWAADDRHVIVGGWTGVPAIVDTASANVTRYLYGHGPGWITSMARLRDRLLTWSKDGTLREWSLEQTADRLFLKGAVTRLALTGPQSAVRAGIHGPKPAGRSAVWRQDGIVHTESFNTARAVAWSPDGSRLAVLRRLDSAGDGPPASAQSAALIEVLLADSRGPWPVRLTLRTDYAAEEVLWSPQGDRLLVTSAASDPPFSVVLDAASGREISRLPAAPDLNLRDGELPSPIAWSPDGKRIAMGDGEVLYDASTGQAANPAVTVSMERLAMKCGGPIISAAWSPDGSRLAFGFADSGHILVLDARSGASLADSALHGGWVRALAFSPDGTRLATAGQDRTVRLVDASTLSPLLIFRDHEADVRAVAWSADGLTLASADADGNLILRMLPTNSQQRR